MSAHGITLTGYSARWASGLIVEPLGTWDSTGQEQLVIESASDEWQGVITSTFWSPGAEDGTDMLMTDGACIVPPEALAAPGNGTVTLRCTNAQGRRISVDLAYHSAGHAQVPGSPSEPTPDLWQQYVEQVQADADRAEQASKDAAGSADAAAKSAEAAAESAKQAAQATSDIDEAKDAALEAIQQAQDTGVKAVQTATTTGVKAIQQAHQAALDDIATDRQQALTDIEGAGDKQQSAITSSGAAALEAIGRVEQTAIGQVQQAGTTQVAAVQTAGQAQQTAIEQAGQSWQQQIAAAGTAELGRWAPAIWDTAPLAAEHDIYAAEGAPLRVTQQGKTQQETTTGRNLLPWAPFAKTTKNGVTYECVEDGIIRVTGTATASADSPTMDLTGLQLPPGTYCMIPSGYGKLIPQIVVRKAATGQNYWYSPAAVVIEEGDQPQYFYISCTEIGVALNVQVYAYLQAGKGPAASTNFEPYTGGAPSPSPDYPQEIEGIDSPVTAQTSDGQTTHSISMDIGSPLYGDGSVVDTVANDLPSGCDKVITVDGTTVAFEDSASGINYILPRNSTPDVLSIASGGSFASNALPGGVWNTNEPYDFVFCNTNKLPQFADVDALNEYCQQLAAAGTPLKIWYKSTAYTEAADLHIDKATRRWRMVELDGTEIGSRVAASGGGNHYYYQMQDAKFSGGLASSTPGWEDATKSTHFLPGNAFAEEGNLAAVLTHSRVSSCRLGFSPDPFTSYQEMQSWLAAQAAAGTPVRVLYQLATPEEYASDPHTLPALGSLPETVKATGESTVEYSADTKSYIDAKFAALSAAMLGG